MIKRSDIQKIVSEYSDLTVGTLGSHSALEIMDGAKDENLRTLVVCQKGREKPYERFARLSDEIIIVNKFKDMLSSKSQSRLRAANTIIIPHRALTAYLGYEAVENKFRVPLFGNRTLLQAEERSNGKNQYYLLEKAKIRHPKLFKDPKDIDRPVIIKVQEKSRKLERAFFNVYSYSDYKDKTETKIRQGLISRDALKVASIEEFVIGTYFNFNYFHTPISEEVDFLGIERR
jgi:5-formaminoimidazole-4-carboxamide-1-(beta)-D-ribofuranosyl 5'-monophosphate synthetase